MSLFALSSTILAVIGDDAKYNGVDVKVLIDHDVEIVTDAEIMVGQILGHIESSAVHEVVDHDEILHQGVAYGVRRIHADDGDMKVLLLRKI